MDANQIAGKAMYLEFRNGPQTYQVIVTPDGLTKEGRYVPATMYRRQISAAKPRKIWKPQTLPGISLDTFGAFVKMTDAENAEKHEKRFTYALPTFSRLADYAYRLYKTPIFVEVAVEDMDDIRASRTPYKILGRITRVRRTLGFGESFFETNS